MFVAFCEFTELQLLTVMLTRPEHSRPTDQGQGQTLLHYQGHNPKAKATAIPMQRLTMKYEVMNPVFSSTLTRIQAQFNNITHH